MPGRAVAALFCYSRAYPAILRSWNASWFEVTVRGIQQTTRYVHCRSAVVCVCVVAALCAVRHRAPLFARQTNQLTSIPKLAFHNCETLFFVIADVTQNIQIHFHTVWISVRDWQSHEGLSVCLSVCREHHAGCHSCAVVGGWVVKHWVPFVAAHGGSTLFSDGYKQFETCDLNMRFPSIILNTFIIHLLS